MGWSLGYDSKWERDIGYGVPAYCDHPECKKRINRGLSYVCGGEPYGGEEGCGLYFCSDHHPYIGQLCDRCAHEDGPYTPKPDHPYWVAFKATDESWAEWRKKQLGTPLV